MTLLKYFPQKQKKNMKKNNILCFPYIKNIHQLTTSFITNIMSLVQIIILQHFCFFYKTKYHLHKDVIYIIAKVYFVILSHTSKEVFKGLNHEATLLSWDLRTIPFMLFVYLD